MGLSFTRPGANVTRVEFLRGEKIVESVPSASSVQIPYEILHYGGSFVVRWTINVGGKEYVETEMHTVVTPVFTQSELVAHDPDFGSLSAAQVKRLEALVRQIISTYCNQKFELEYGVSRLVRTSPISWRSSKRVVSIADAVYSIGPDHYSVYNLDTYTSKGYNVKIPIEAEAYIEGWHPSSIQIVKVVEGSFGWIAVPEEVRTAALALAESFSCDESLWRERYIKSIRAADWRFDYSEQTFASTGSLLADQLLAPFVKMEYSIV